MIWIMRVLAIALMAFVMVNGEQTEPARIVRGPLLHAHNAYPEKGQWADRIDRALGTGARPIVIEQDIALATRGGRAVAVVSHNTELTGAEPTLEQYFFARVSTLMERALAEGNRAMWPVVVLHLDFKTNEAAHHRAVWELLQRHQRWLTTAPRHTDAGQVMPMTAGPLLVLTENGAGQEASFSDPLRPGEPLLLFGSAPAPDAARIDDAEQRARALAEAPPDVLITTPATNYRRWVNFSWQAIESGGQPQAQAWTAADAARLKVLVARAHTLGYAIRFYTLNGHEPAQHPEWTASYNFGSLEAAKQRWSAAIDAGVDLIATDQYEALAGLLKQPR